MGIREADDGEILALKEEAKLKAEADAQAAPQPPADAPDGAAPAAGPAAVPSESAHSAFVALQPQLTPGLTPLERAKMLAARFSRPAVAQTGASGLGQFFGDGNGNVAPGVDLNSAVTPGMTPQQAALARARVLAMSLGQAGELRQASGAPLNPDHHAIELDINDYPAEARFRSTVRDVLSRGTAHTQKRRPGRPPYRRRDRTVPPPRHLSRRVQEETGAAIIQRGAFFAPGRVPELGEKRLYLAIEGPSDLCVKAAKAEMLRILNEETMAAALGRGRGRGTGRGAGNSDAQMGKYSLI
ncbi:hypothetical protein M885DRAFT_132296 [Pelagophyceae sp. CCMP2097]|nr:hypothetical protein M885DRAFT_132296 [Pelagophyceae sp. CCMP2097]